MSFRDSAIKFNEILSKAPYKENPKLLACYTNFSIFIGEIEIIADRVQSDVQDFEESIRLFQGQENDKIIAELLKKSYESFTKLMLDLKDVFIHTRIFLDTICKIIKIFYGRPGEQFPESMTDLLKNDKTLEIDNRFFTGLRNKMSWYSDFTENKRDRIVHKLGYFVMTNTKDGKIGYGITKSFNETWGSDTVESVDKFVQDTLSNLSELLEYLASNLKFSG
jgi:hypothetical protein